MMPCLKNNSGRFLCHWWKRSVYTYERCWIQVQFTLAIVCGVTLWYWFKKKDGSLHFCIDFCHLNAHMKKDSTHCQESKKYLRVWSAQAIFSFLDMKSGFQQIKMDKLSRQYTALTVNNLGFFECDHMPFGLCNTPATFQRLMQNYLRKLNLTYSLIYLDNIIVFSQTAEEHLHHLCVVFD